MTDPDDGDDASHEAGAAGIPDRPPTGPTGVPREKPVIESRAEASEAPVEDTSGETQDGSAEHPSAPISPDAESAPPTAELAPPDAAPPMAEADNAAPTDAAPPRRAGLWPFAAAIVLAALIGVGGAFGLHMLDKTPTRLNALGARLNALEQRPDPTEALRTTQAALEKRVAALETASREAQATAAGLRSELSKLAAQKAAMPAPATGAAPDLASLEARVGALEAKLAALDTKVGGLAGTLDAQKSQVRATEDRVTQSAAARADSEAVAILAASLLRKVEAGVPYTAELAALGNRGLDKTKLATLEPAAASGVATAPALAKQFSELSGAILTTEPPAKENGFLERVLHDAARLVRIRKVGDTSGDDLASRLARVQVALNAGAVETAYQQWNALPDAAKAKSAAFGTAAKNRIDALAAARTLDAEAMAALTKARS